MLVRIGRLLITGAIAACVTLSPRFAYAQGHGHAYGHGKQGGVTAGSGSATPLPASGAGARNFGVWLDDASVAAPGGGWMSVSFGYYRTDLFREFDVPVADAGVGLNKRAQFGFTVPVYNLNMAGAAPARGLGDLYLHSKIQLRDASHGFGYALVPIVEVASGVQAEGQRRVNWALPISMEVQRNEWRVYGATGYFSRGSLFASGALERAISSQLSITGTLSTSYSTKADVVPVPGLSRVRTDVSGGASYAVRPTWIVFGSLGRTISAHDENTTILSLSGGVTLNLAAPADVRTSQKKR
ncbi:MAG: hypothetical protein DMF84_10855 [Acidobacteria bacterium]|nr:MAG: hypothetical protein DMF84_10855 [Acidobacteriota bacterium]